jgi:iron-sulfur cluster insertion protein
MATSTTQPNTIIPDAITTDTVTSDIIITDNAKNRISELLQNCDNNNTRLRIYIEGRSCSGFSYCFSFEEPLDEDIRIKHNNCEVIIDPISLEFMQGSTLDYHNTLTESYFVINNPKEQKSSCACGASSC